jgi:DNA-binding MarR family transcriptional regulator
MLPSSCFWALCVRIARKISEKYDHALKPSGLSGAQFHLLTAINRLQLPTLKDIAIATGLDCSTLGRNVRVLKQEGYVELNLGVDGSRRVVILIRMGRKSMRIDQSKWEKAQDQMQSVLPTNTYK